MNHNNLIQPQLRLPDIKFNFIRNGLRGIVLRISKEYAAKILYDGNCLIDTDNFLIRNDNDAYIMEYLPYPSGAELGFHEFPFAKSKAQDEILKAMDYGFIPGNDSLNPNNFMYNRKARISYLIDFEFWDLNESKVIDNLSKICERVN